MNLLWERAKLRFDFHWKLSRKYRIFRLWNWTTDRSNSLLMTGPNKDLLTLLIFWIRSNLALAILWGDATWRTRTKSEFRLISIPNIFFIFLTVFHFFTRCWLRWGKGEGKLFLLLDCFSSSSFLSIYDTMGSNHKYKVKWWSDTEIIFSMNFLFHCFFLLLLCEFY